MVDGCKRAEEMIFMVTTQLRVYTVRPGRLDEWVRLWRDRIVPLRRELGFEIHGSWVDPSRSEHIWVISHPGPASFEEANAAYWASPARETLGVDPKEFLVDERVQEIQPVLL
jgi:hypothetical protein